MNPEDLIKELVQQNKLLKETIPFLLTAANDDFHTILNGSEELSRSTWSECSEKEADSSHSETDSIVIATSPSSHTSSISTNSNQQTAIQTLLDLLDRQESRLDLLEKFGKSVLLQSNNIHHIPIFRGREKPSKPKIVRGADENEKETVAEEEGGEIEVKEWTRKILEHIKKIKAFNSSSTRYETKEIIRLIYDKLDLEPLEFLKSILKENYALVYNLVPKRGAIQLVESHQRLSNHLITQQQLDQLSVDALFECPFKLDLLRHPKALLNLLNSKF